MTQIGSHRGAHSAFFFLGYAIVVVGKPEMSENRLFFCPRGKHQPIAFNIDAKVEFSTKRNYWYRTGQPAQMTIGKELKTLKTFFRLDCLFSVTVRWTER